MGTQLATRAVSEREYLASPEYEHYEYINGEAVEMKVGTLPHSRIQVNCGSLLRNYFESRGGGYAAAEARCRLVVAGQTRYYQPDVCAVVGERSAQDRFLEGAPELVVEIQSPGDTVAELVRKMADYFANGAKLGWDCPAGGKVSPDPRRRSDGADGAGGRRD